MTITYKKIVRKMTSLLQAICQYVLLFCFPMRFIFHDEPCLFYGRIIKHDAKFAHGGKVKILHLIKRFPETRISNILYLVSSALPVGYSLLIKEARRKGIKIVWNQNGVGYKAWAGNNYHSVNRSLAHIHYADYVIYQSEFCKRAADKFLGQFSGDWTVMYNCVDFTHFSPASPPPSILKPKLLLMGTHNDSYRVMCALDVLKELRSNGHLFELLIGGAFTWPNGNKEVQEAIACRNLESAISLHGSYRQADAPSLYRAAHILLHLQYNDASPTVPIEAMACGLPVVASGSGGTPEIIGEEGGVCVPVPEDFDSILLPESYLLTSAIITIISDWNHWSRTARSRAVAQFSKDQWLDAHNDLFTKLTQCK